MANFETNLILNLALLGKLVSLTSMFELILTNTYFGFELLPYLSHQ